MARPIRRFARPAAAALTLFVAALIAPAAVPVAEAQCTVTFCATCPADPTCASCNPGFFLNGGANTCNDVNECATTNGGCAAPPVGQCANTIGSRTCSCITGYTGSGLTCADINECATTNGGCAAPPAGSCTNTAGSRSCTCSIGYAGNGLTCNDINECATNNGGCAVPPGGACTNTAGSRDCTCSGGYAGNGFTCNDVNECAVANGGCSPLAGCTNDPGSYACGACPGGYSGDGMICNDINECATAGGGCGSGFDCSNQPGTHDCTDINECAIANQCNAGSCTNGDGTFACECQAGVTGTTCDINGYLPPDKPTAACAKAVSDNIVKYVKCLTKCRTQKASKTIGGKAFDEQDCASGPKSCRSAYDKKMLSLVENGTCPTCLDQATQTGLADDALAAIVATKGAAYCAGTVPLEP